MTPIRKDPDDVKDDFLKVRTTSERLQRWKDAAAKAKAFEDHDDMDFSEWVRRALNEAMNREARRYDTTAPKRGKGGGR